MRLKTAIRIVPIGLVLVALAACAGRTEDGTTSTGAGTTEPGSSSAMGPGISVDDAIDSASDGPVLVNGYLFVDADGVVTLASAIAESMPPQPGGARLTVEGLNPGEYEMSESQGIRWTDSQVQVLGAVEGDTLVVTPTMSG